MEIAGLMWKNKSGMGNKRESLTFKKSCVPTVCLSTSCLRFALFLVVVTAGINVARELESVSDVFRVVEVNNSHIKARRSCQTASVHPFTRALLRD
ncbi:hypothetical protein AVEN_139374-1 [Araneus ventricosus]|uniref:Uncharacterized protein n=1 Tax=Araneus ventricosus TaxID=182803 RepID=A0A4Y2EB70_ARAVE|nr:hypothetical protein AVEN_139374-1 [Araneus ventricosus]